MSVTEPVFYPAVIHHENTGYSASVPDLPGCFTQGETIEELLVMLEAAVQLYLDCTAAYPSPSSPQSLSVEPFDSIIQVPYRPESNISQ